MTCDVGTRPKNTPKHLHNSSRRNRKKGEPWRNANNERTWVLLIGHASMSRVNACSSAHEAVLMMRRPADLTPWEARNMRLPPAVQK